MLAVVAAATVVVAEDRVGERVAQRCEARDQDGDDPFVPGAEQATDEATAVKQERDLVRGLVLRVGAVGEEPVAVALEEAVVPEHAHRGAAVRFGRERHVGAAAPPLEELAVEAVALAREHHLQVRVGDGPGGCVEHDASFGSSPQPSSRLRAAGALGERGAGSGA